MNEEVGIVRKRRSVPVQVAVVVVVVQSKRAESALWHILEIPSLEDPMVTA